MSDYGKEAIHAMKEAKTGNTVGEVRWYFENVALPFKIFTAPREIMEVAETDPLVPYRLFDELLKGMGLEDPFTMTPDMVMTGAAGDGDRMILISMPDPDSIGHAYAAVVFTNSDYDMPGYFLAVKGDKNTVHLIAWDYNANAYNLGMIRKPEDLAEQAYGVYLRSRPAVVG